MRREAARVLEEVLLPGRFKGDEGRKRGEKVTEGAERNGGRTGKGGKMKSAVKGGR